MVLVHQINEMSIVKRYFRKKIAFYVLRKYIGKLKESTKEFENLFLTGNAQRQYFS